jgi:hypothetical protein
MKFNDVTDREALKALEHFVERRGAESYSDLIAKADGPGHLACLAFLAGYLGRKAVEPKTTRLWLLERPADAWDVQDGCVVEAPDEAAARLQAAFTAGDEGKDVWLDAKRANCKEVQLTGETRTILRSFCAG